MNENLKEQTYQSLIQTRYQIQKIAQKTTKLPDIFAEDVHKTPDQQKCWKVWRFHSWEDDGAKWSLECEAEAFLLLRLSSPSACTTESQNKKARGSWKLEEEVKKVVVHVPLRWPDS